MTLEDKLKTIIRDVPDFLNLGLFKDISTTMLDPKMSKETLEYLRQLYQDKPIDAIAGIESRGSYLDTHWQWLWMFLLS